MPRRLGHGISLVFDRGEGAARPGSKAMWELSRFTRPVYLSYLSIYAKSNDVSRTFHAQLRNILAGLGVQFRPAVIGIALRDGIVTATETG